jgi:hypothetical protein
VALPFDRLGGPKVAWAFGATRWSFLPKDSAPVRGPARPEGTRFSCLGALARQSSPTQGQPFGRVEPVPRQPGSAWAPVTRCFGGASGRRSTRRHFSVRSGRRQLKGFLTPKGPSALQRLPTSIALRHLKDMAHSPLARLLWRQASTGLAPDCSRPPTRGPAISKGRVRRSGNRLLRARYSALARFWRRQASTGRAPGCPWLPARRPAAARTRPGGSGRFYSWRPGTQPCVCLLEANLRQPHTELLLAASPKASGPEDRTRRSRFLSLLGRRSALRLSGGGEPPPVAR